MITLNAKNSTLNNLDSIRIDSFFHASYLIILFWEYQKKCSIYLRISHSFFVSFSLIQKLFGNKFQVQWCF
jgi:hypothetical protein